MYPLAVAVQRRAPITSPGLSVNPGFFLSRRPHVERVAIFIDGSNFYHCLKDEFGIAKLDMGKLVEKVRAGRDLVRTY